MWLFIGVAGLLKRKSYFYNIGFETLRILRALCVSAVKLGDEWLTAETQSTPRTRRDGFVPKFFLTHFLATAYSEIRS